MYKIYSAFVSSVYESLKDERKEVIDSLLNKRVYPICMEHFAISTNENFDGIKELIDDSDFMVLILGKEYGSCDENGISWTEREYDYALESNTDVLAIICDELMELRQKHTLSPESLTPDETKQLNFTSRISFAIPISDKNNIQTIVEQFFTGKENKYPGWTRRSSIMFNQKKLENWRKEKKEYDLNGIWYHAHISPDDPYYIRIGTITIKQVFDPENYKQLHFDGQNYNLLCVKKDGNFKIEIDPIKFTHWKGDYTLDDNGHICGIFEAKREFSDTYNGENVDEGIRRGIHDFDIIAQESATQNFSGRFHDEAPSRKKGIIHVFKNSNDRDDFVKTHCEKALRKILTKTKKMLKRKSL